MQLIKDGLRYDTETAEEVARASSGCPGDFRRRDETLYRTSMGRYFVHGTGGAMTQWAKTCDGGNTRCGGAGILPMSPSDVLAWLEANKEDVPEDCPELSELVKDA